MITSSTDVLDCLADLLIDLSTKKPSESGNKDGNFAFPKALENIKEDKNVRTESYKKKRTK